MPITIRFPFQASVVNCPTKTECDIRLRATTICAFLWLDVGNIRGHFSDNGFTMTEHERLLRFHSRDSITPSDLQNSLTVAALDKRRLDERSSEVDPVTSTVDKMNQFYPYT